MAVTTVNANVINSPTASVSTEAASEPRSSSFQSDSDTTSSTPASQQRLVKRLRQEVHRKATEYVVEANANSDNSSMSFVVTKFVEVLSPVVKRALPYVDSLVDQVDNTVDVVVDRCQQMKKELSIDTAELTSCNLVETSHVVRRVAISSVSHAGRFASTVYQTTQDSISKSQEVARAHYLARKEQVVILSRKGTEMAQVQYNFARTYVVTVVFPVVVQYANTLRSASAPFISKVTVYLQASVQTIMTVFYQKTAALQIQIAAWCSQMLENENVQAWLAKMRASVPEAYQLKTQEILALLSGYVEAAKVHTGCCSTDNAEKKVK